MHQIAGPKIPVMDADRRQEMALEPGTELGPYRIERALGRGGMGLVFLARDRTLHRQVAIKILGTPDDDGTARARLLCEARNAAALNHPNICTVYEVGDADGRAFIAMEYVDGEPLSDRLAGAGLSFPDVLRYGVEVADALVYAHDHGVIHGDLKAANAMITAAGRLKLVDFGLARRDDALLADATTIAPVVPAGVAAGTPYSMAPEQIRGAAPAVRTDVWALGVLLHEMASGAKPFSAPTNPELFSSILRDPSAPLPPGVPVSLRSVIERCLEKEPARRYASAREVQGALDAIQSGPAARGVAGFTRVPGRPWAAAVAAALALVAVLLVANVDVLRSRLGRGPSTDDPIKLAVLPFENMTGDPEQDYFSDGLTEEMISHLGRLHPQRLSVIARTSSMRYKNRDTPLGQIGRELGVDYVLEGSARREGTRVRINATLVRVSDLTQRWTDSFDRELAGILALQNDVARSVAGSLRLSLLPLEQARLASTRPVDPDAYEAYLSGRFHADKLTPPDLDRALDYFARALEKDPAYAPAYSGIASVWISRNQMGYVRPAEAIPRIRAAAAQALELDGALARAHAALAGAAFVEWDLDTSEREFQRTLELDPNDPAARAFYAHLLVALNRFDEAVAQAERAMQLDPLNAFHQALYGTVLYLARRNDAAIVEFQSALKTSPDLPPAHCGLWYAYNSAGRPEQALAGAEGCIGHYGGEIREAMTRGFSAGGYKGAMRRVADRLASGLDGAYVAPVDVLIPYVHAGEKDLALQWLSRTVEARDPNVYGVLSDPFVVDSLGGDPRFLEIRRRTKLPG